MIIIPMAGMSRRFTEAGFTVPKYMLEAHGATLFAHAVKSFEKYFHSTPFLFIARDVHETQEFINIEAEKLGITNFQVVILKAPTSGQAETVSIGLDGIDLDPNTPITIFNIDTFRPGYTFPTNFELSEVDGYLEVFRGDGANWSYVRPDPQLDSVVIETTEKIPVSDLCCTGLYHFRTAKLFQDTYAEFITAGPQAFNLTELYIAPMYNLLIKDSKDIRYEIIGRNEVIFCGVPSEYEDFLRG